MLTRFVQAFQTATELNPRDAYRLTFRSTSDLVQDMVNYLVLYVQTWFEGHLPADFLRMSAHLAGCSHDPMYRHNITHLLCNPRFNV